MAKISLRAYNHEIGNLIDHGQTEEASAHCKYILKIFPKHLDTYRLLGKTYLESQRYSEASDILQRVLAVVPDDFVSQIGLSIIREDEGNLDAAIWNMERAFEVQPSNAAVQEELRRLYGNRDGVQPPRVRLTRGALVRMYTKGNLFQQAIAEARAAIAESPKRTDLEILLARNYYLSKNFVEATEICSRLVKKMPYCYEANLILADILPKANKAEEARIFAKRVQELDPYAAFTDRSAATSAQVPDDAVTLEKLDWQPSMEDAEQPRWAKSIGVDIGSQSDQPSNDWLSDMPENTPESSAPMPFIIPEISTAKSEESLPGWMKEDEWTTGKDAEIPGENQQSSAFIMDDAEGLQEAEIPEWLQSMAPDEIDQGQSSASPSPFEMPAPESSDASDWTNGLLGDTPAANDYQPDSESPFLGAEPTGDEEVPERMQDMNTKAEEEPADESPASTLPDFSDNESDDPSFNLETPEDYTPDWLKDMEGSVSQPSQQTAFPEAALPGVTDMLGKPTQEPEVPDWLSAMEQDDAIPVTPQPTSAASPADEMPDWLQDIESPVSQPETSAVDMPGVTDMLGKPAQEPELPDWLSEIEQDEAVPAKPETKSSVTPADEVPDWMHDLESPVSQPGKHEADLPGVTDMLGKPIQEPEVPDWLSEIDSGSEDTLSPADDLPDDIYSQQEVDTPKAADETPDWLKELESSEPGMHLDTEPAPAQESTLASSDEVPDWEQVKDETSNIGAALPAAVIGAAAMFGDEQDEAQDETRPQESKEMPEDPDEAFAWLESLAAQQGADEEALSTPVEERDTAVPEWLQALDSTTPQAKSDPDSLDDLDETQSDSELPLNEPVSDDELPDWLKDLDVAGNAKQPEQRPSPTVESEMSPTSSAAGGKFTDWLNELDKDAPPDELSAEENQDQEATPISDAIPAQPASSASLPDWLQDFSGAATPESETETLDEPAIEESPISDIPAEEQSVDNGSVPDWLNELAEDEPEMSDEDAELESPEGLQITLPDWMQSDDQTVKGLPPAAKPSTIPDWLEELKPADSKQTATERITPIAPTDPSSAEIDQQDSIPPSMASSDDETLVLSHKAQDEAHPQKSEEIPADTDDAFAWLESLAAKHGADEDALVTATDERQETPPEWVQDLGSTEDSQPEEGPSQTGTFSISDLDTGVDLLNAVEEIPAAPSLEQDEAEAKAQQWLQSLASGKPVEDLEAPPSADEISPDKTDQPGDETAETLATPFADEMPADPNEAFAWLESLAAQQGADEEALSTPPEERDSTTPDWLQNTEEDLVAEEPPLATVSDIPAVNSQEETLPSETVDLNPADEMPSDPAEAFAWLESLAAQQGADEEALSTPPEERDSTTPDWLQNTDEDLVAEEPHLATFSNITAVNAQEETLPSETVDLNPADEMPSDPAEAFAWLESLAAQQGADEEALSTPPEERDSTTPDWLQNTDEDLVAEEPHLATFSNITAVNAQDEMPPSETVDLYPADEMPSDPDEAFAWLESLAAQQGADEEALSTPPEERDSTTPDWLRDIEKEIDSEGQPQQKSESVAQDTPFAEQKADLSIENAFEAMDLPELGSQPVSEEPFPDKPQDSPSLPEWLKEFEEPVAEEPTAIADSDQQVPQDETVIRWLHDMDEKDGKIPSSAAEPPEQGSAAQNVITEPIKNISVPQAEEIPDETQVETVQSTVEEPVLEIAEEPVQENPPIEEPIAREDLSLSAPPSEGSPEIVETSDMLINAQKLISKGQIEESVAIYKTLIAEETQIDAVIKDLNDALLHHPVDTILWLTLGDAYMQKKEMQSALSAYTKAEELLR